VENKPLMAIEPSPYIWMLMGGVVVEDDIHRGDRGSASIRVQAPNGRERVLNFDGGDVSTPNRGQLTWGKEGDTWYIGIDEREFYVVPEAAVYGG
jgi:hypothetical protein